MCVCGEGGEGGVCDVYVVCVWRLPRWCGVSLFVFVCVCVMCSCLCYVFVFGVCDVCV